MATERTDGNGEGGAHMTERYTGPSAKRIADLLSHRVSFERGLVLDDDGHLSPRQVGRAGVQAATGRQRHRHSLPHRRLLGRRGDNRT